MNRKLIPLIAAAFAVSLASACGNVENSGSSSENKTTTTAVQNKTTDSSTSEPSTAASTTEAKTTEQTKTSDSEKLSGYWFIDGDTSLAYFHISEDYRFRTYYADGNIESTGYAEYETDSAGLYHLSLYNDDNSLYLELSGESQEELRSSDGVRYVWVFGNGGLGDDGRGQDETDFEGRWACDRANINIENLGSGEFSAVITWGNSAWDYVEWKYPLTLDNDRLVCDGKGVKTHIFCQSDNAEPVETIIYSDGSVIFELTENGMVWNDLTENRGEDMLFISLPLLS